MIDKFGILYAGHTDIGNIGFKGTPVNDRFLSDDELAAPMFTSVDLAQNADKWGYETLWLAEHHFQREGYECLANLILLGVHIANLTEKIKVGCAFNIAPMWHPVRLAEDYAAADHLTDGRIVFGVGRGYHTREVEVFGAPMLDQAANRDMFEEQVEVILKSFNNASFSHHGKYYDIPPKVPYRGYELEEITLVPRPKYLPVDCWQPIVSANPRGLKFMAKHGIKGIIGGGAGPGGASEKVVRAYQEALAEEGRETQLGEGLAVGIDIYLADTQEKAIAEAMPYYEENMKMFGPLNFVPGLTDQQKLDLEYPTDELIPTLPKIEDFIKAGSYLFGPPETIIEGLMAVQDAYPGVEQVNVQVLSPFPRARMLEQFEWFAKEVMPAFKAPAKVAAS